MSLVLAVGQRDEHHRLVVGRARLAMPFEHLFSELICLLGDPEMHRHAGSALQCHAELAERVAEGDRLLDAAPHVGLLAEPGASPVERCQRLHDAVAVVHRPEPVERALGELLGVGESTCPEPHVGEQRLHHQ